MDKDISTEQKTWQVYNFRNRNVFRLDLNESREGFHWRGRVRSSHVDGLKTQKGAGTNNKESGTRCEESRVLSRGTDFGMKPVTRAQSLSQT